MNLRARLAALDQKVLPGTSPSPSSSAIRRAAGLLAMSFALAVAANVLVQVVFDAPGWVGPAVSGGIIWLAGAVIITRLLRER